MFTQEQKLSYALMKLILSHVTERPVSAKTVLMLGIFELVIQRRNPHILFSDS